MNATIFKIIGIALLVQAVNRDWSDWQGVVFGVAVGAYLMVLKNLNEKK